MSQGNGRAHLPGHSSIPLSPCSISLSLCLNPDYTWSYLPSLSWFGFLTLIHPAFDSCCRLCSTKSVWVDITIYTLPKPYLLLRLAEHMMSLPLRLFPFAAFSSDSSVPKLCPTLPFPFFSTHKPRFHSTNSRPRHSSLVARCTRPTHPVSHSPI